MNKPIDTKESPLNSFLSKTKNFISKFVDIFKQDKLAIIGLIVFICFVGVAIFAPMIAPYDEMERHRDENGELRRTDSPSSEHLFGTTNRGRDVFSQVIMGSRVALFVGALAALFVTFIGTNIGLISGYFGGFLDNLFMRIVDISYAIPFIPFVIILVTLLEPSLFNIVLAITILSWRTIARIIRAQVLSVKERPYVKAARVAGASNLRIIFLYILPNVLPLALLEMSLRMAQAIIAEASVSFLGFGDPTVISWGQILQRAFMAGAMRDAWWWVIPPGIAISLLIVAVFFTSRALEIIANPQLRRR
ncbi:peptide ABC transporter permease [Natranaerobius trueperi]|uniref:Peptide ABC transporter permease n=1 Tax=Natranaerobius trueperi TaxID=759412 RepID=A0A226BYE0_9FIRM|nr:peptide ABC transporter permease [Natranaerobius trueperi]